MHLLIFQCPQPQHNGLSESASERLTFLWRHVFALVASFSHSECRVWVNIFERFKCVKMSRQHFINVRNTSYCNAHESAFCEFERCNCCEVSFREKCVFFALSFVYCNFANEFGFYCVWNELFFDFEFGLKRGCFVQISKGSLSVV